MPWSFVSLFFKLIAIFKLGHKVVVRAPTCSLCRRAERKKRLLLMPVVLVLAVISLLLASIVVSELLKMLQWVGNMPQWLGIFQGVFNLALAVAIFLPPVLVLDRLNPSAVEIGIEGGELVFKFRDAQYARDFEALNTRTRAADLQRQVFALLAELGALSPDGLAQLFAQLGALGDAHLGRQLGDIEDNVLLGTLRAELLARSQATPNPSLQQTGGPHVGAR